MKITEKRKRGMLHLRGKHVILATVAHYTEHGSSSRRWFVSRKGLVATLSRQLTLGLV